jgi:hypothetical protein
MVLVGDDLQGWVTTDCGARYALLGPGELGRVKFSHVNANWLLFSRLVKCKPSRPACKKDTEDLYLWTGWNKTELVHQGIEHFNWVSNTDNILEGFPMDSFIFTSMQSKGTKAEKLHLYYASELGAQKKVIVDDLFAYSVSQNFLYIVKNSDSETALEVAELRQELKFSTVHLSKTVKSRSATFMEFDSTQSFAFFETTDSNNHRRVRFA